MRARVLRWMIANRVGFVDNMTGEVNLTGLAEGAAREFDLDHEDGPLDDETHWIWDLAIEAAEA